MNTRNVYGQRASVVAMFLGAFLILGTEWFVEYEAAVWKATNTVAGVFVLGFLSQLIGWRDLANKVRSAWQLGR